MKLVFTLIAVVTAFVDCPIGFAAQHSGKVYRIGYLTSAAAPRPAEEAFRKRLQELGYIEGQNLTIDWQFTKGDSDRFQGIVAELVNRPVDIIVAHGVQLTRLSKQATDMIPIVMANADDDPVDQGLVASLARPGGNVTGFTNIGSDLAGKRIELLKEIVPKATRMAIIASAMTRRDGANAAHIRESQAVAPALGIKLQSIEVQRPPDAAGIERAFKLAVAERVNGLIVLSTGGVGNQMAQIISLAVKNRLPAIYTSPDFVRGGGLASYSDDALDRLRRVAEYVDRILKGTKPADLPVQRPAKFEFIINLVAAKQIGFTVPPNVLARADRVVK